MESIKHTGSLDIFRISQILRLSWCVRNKSMARQTTFLDLKRIQHFENSLKSLAITFKSTLQINRDHLQLKTVLVLHIVEIINTIIFLIWMQHLII